MHDMTAIRRHARDAGLDGYRKLRHYTHEQLETLYTGTDVGRMPYWVRQAVDGLDPCLAPAILIYNVDRHECDGTRKGWMDGHDRLVRNGLLLIGRAHGHDNPAGRNAIRQLHAYTQACMTSSGWHSWADRSLR